MCWHCENLRFRVDCGHRNHLSSYSSCRLRRSPFPPHTFYTQLFRAQEEYLTCIEKNTRDIITIGADIQNILNVCPGCHPQHACEYSEQFNQLLVELDVANLQLDALLCLQNRQRPPSRTNAGLGQTTAGLGQTTAGLTRPRRPLRLRIVPNVQTVPPRPRVLPRTGAETPLP